MATASLCSSYGCPAGPSQEREYQGSETLRSIVAGALSISGSLSISPSGIAQRRAPAALSLQQQQLGTATPALQQMLPQLSILCGTPMQLSDGMPLSPTGATWQDALFAAPAAVPRSSSANDADSCKPMSKRPSARRCLCLSLTQQHHDSPVAATPSAPDAAAALPPLPPFTPNLGTSSSSCTPAGAWSLAPAAAAAAAALPAHGGGSCCSSSSSVLCSHGSSSSRGRLQAWLNRMELQLQVPATPLVPPVEPCPAPKGGHSRPDGHESRKRALQGAFNDNEEPHDKPAAANFAAAAADAGTEAAAGAQRSSKRRSSGSSTGAAAVEISAAAGGLPAAVAAAALGGCSDPHMEDGTAAGLTAAVAADDLAATAAGAGGVTVPAPAFVLLGVISAGRGSSSE